MHWSRLAAVIQHEARGERIGIFKCENSNLHNASANEFTFSCCTRIYALRTVPVSQFKRYTLMAFRSLATDVERADES
ncbi:protein of unknown function [Candidatus Filomicrobium marinum]|uniref:Uncharacterized protein n=1 Tax=Candidatus Filomicrobium marinum TaxID=1608628 RepID=A0A0D6JG93_9HYPH|nr:protein of unknown function [Candidatus Filomicrobium marinum]CPR19296.1 protein of unknown function [Candidatus Filomicrobium marinum]